MGSMFKDSKFATILRRNFGQLLPNWSKKQENIKSQRHKVKATSNKDTKIQWFGGGYVIRFKFYDNSKKQFSFNLGQIEEEKEEEISIEASYSKYLPIWRGST